MKHEDPEVIVATVTKIDPHLGLITLQDEDGATIKTHKLMLQASGFQAVSVGDRVHVLATARVEYDVKSIVLVEHQGGRRLRK